MLTQNQMILGKLSYYFWAAQTKPITGSRGMAFLGKVAFLGKF